MEREFRTEVKSLFDDMVGRQQGELSVRDQCEHAYEELTATVNGKYKELTGKDLPASMARNLDQLLTQITMAPLNEPEHGPGLWAKLPQHSITTMVEARPLDLTGSPTRMDIDLMMLHTIRMGRFLTTHYTDWAQTLPPCWIRHDDVVQEVYALKCYMDLVVASPQRRIVRTDVAVAHPFHVGTRQSVSRLVRRFELRPSASPVRTGGTPTGAGQAG